MTRPAIWRSLLVLYLLLGLASSASAQSAEALWTEATETMAAGEEREAVTLLRSLVRGHPETPLADDALFLAATLLEEKLHSPLEARSAYQELLEAYPDSRSALAAQRRLAALERALGRDGLGAEPLAMFEDILSGFPNRRAEQSLQLARDLLQKYPGWTGTHRVRIWIAETHRRQGDLSIAWRYFDEVRASPDAPAHAAVQAMLGAAELEILRGDYAAATRSLEALSQRPGLSLADAQSVAQLTEMLSDSRARARLVQLSYATLASMLLVLIVLLRLGCESAGACVRELARPPLEFLYMLPFALLLTFMAFTGHEEIGPAVAIICGGALLVTWLSGAALRARSPLGLPATILCGGAALLATLSLCYLALHRSQLLDLIATTVRFGPG